MFKDIRQIRFKRKRRWMIERNWGGLQSSGIDLQQGQCSGITCHTNLHLRWPISRSFFNGIRPFIQHSLFALSVSEINPFKQKGDPTMLHDKLIILNQNYRLILKVKNQDYIDLD